METRQFAGQYLTDLKEVLGRFDFDAFEKIVAGLLEAYHAQRRVFVMGNGGSGTTASHFACDINKGCCIDLPKKFKVLCLNDSIPTMLALTNDISYDVVFEAQLGNFFEPGDMVMGISGSGNSTNVLNAIRYARDHGGRTVGLTGFSGGQLAGLVDTAYVADVHDMQKVEDVHMILVHMIMQALYAALHGDAPTPGTAAACG